MNKVMNKIVPPPGNLEDWTSNRLKMLLDEYTASLPMVRAAYGRFHPETRSYEIWIRALQNELDKREQRKS